MVTARYSRRLAQFEQISDVTACLGSITYLSLAWRGRAAGPPQQAVLSQIKDTLYIVSFY